MERKQQAVKLLRKPLEDQHTRNHSLRMTADEYRRFKRAADRAGLVLAVWLRRAAEHELEREKS